MNFSEPLPGMFTRSKLLVLDFAHIPADTPASSDISKFFKECAVQGLDPRAPAQRQAFNNRMLAATDSRYLVSQYGEDRHSMLAGSSIAHEGRTIHLGIDVFCADLEPVLAPCDGKIVRIGREPEDHSFGNYLILKPAQPDVPYVFMGHLGSDLPELGEVASGQTIARLGSYENNENGGWSRHLHFQLLSKLPSEDEVPIGYGLQSDMDAIKQKYPDPMPYFPDWLCYNKD